MNQRTIDSNASLIINEEVSQKDKRTPREMGGEMSSQAYLEDLKWPTKNLSKQQQQKPSILDQTQAQERMCANRSGCGMSRSYHPGDYLAQQPHQSQKYKKNLNQSPANKQQTSRDPQQQQPQHLCVEQRSQTPPMPSQYLQTSYPKLPQEQAQRYDSPKKKCSIRASSKGMKVRFLRPPRRNVSFLTENPKPSNEGSSNTDEENLADKRDERDKNTSNKYLEFLPLHYSHQQQHPHEQYRTALNQNSPQRNQSQKKAPISKTEDVLSPCPHILSKNTDVTDFHQYIKELDKNASCKYKEYAPKLGQSPAHLHKHKQEHYQKNSTSRQKVERQQLYPIHLQQQSYPNPCENTCEKPSQRNQSKMQSLRNIPIVDSFIQYGLDRKNVGELQSVSTLYKSMEYVPRKVSLQNPTQRTYQDLTKEKTQKSDRQASQHSHRTSKLKAQKNPQQKDPNQQIADFPPFSRFGDTPEDDSEKCNFGVDKKARNKFMECYGKGFPKHKPKHRQSGAGHGVFSMASSSSVSTSISAKSGDELRAIIWDELQLQSVRGDQTSSPRYKDLEEKVSTRSDLNPPRDLTHPCSNVSKFQDMKETMSKHIGSLSNLAIAVHAPTTDSFKSSTTDQMPQIECSMSVADLVRYKVITPMIMKIHKRYMTHMQNEMHLLKYLETVPRLVGQIYKDNITMEQRKL
ncbi:GL18829 [Drosophila persimilis]|uniref:GL18829 n=1 Tax=Drosophila persimilis TaxID=7234 RepID=B4G8I6_DROPE|nr:GL18829 [Drosophila persimilis]